MFQGFGLFMTGKSADDIICENRIYACTGCKFIGTEYNAELHQIKCDSPMELIK